MDLSTPKLEAGPKIEPEIKEEEFKIEDPIHLATIRPIKIEEKKEPVDDFRGIDVEPQPSTSRAVAEVRVDTPPPLDFKWDPYELAPRGRFSPPPPPADRAKRRSVPGGHASATPRLKFLPYQPRR